MAGEAAAEASSAVGGDTILIFITPAEVGGRCTPAVAEGKREVGENCEELK